MNIPSCNPSQRCRACRPCPGQRVNAKPDHRWYLGIRGWQSHAPKHWKVLAGDIVNSPSWSTMASWGILTAAAMPDIPPPLHDVSSIQPTVSLEQCLQNCNSSLLTLSLLMPRLVRHTGRSQAGYRRQSREALQIHFDKMIKMLCESSGLSRWVNSCNIYVSHASLQSRYCGDSISETLKQ